MMIATDTAEQRGNFGDTSRQDSSQNSLFVDSSWKPLRAVQNSNEREEVYRVATPRCDSLIIRPVIDPTAFLWSICTRSTSNYSLQIHSVEDTTSEAILGGEAYTSLQQAVEGLYTSLYLRLAAPAFGNAIAKIDLAEELGFSSPLLGVESHPVVRRFANGVVGKKPSLDVINTAVRLVQTALALTVEPEINVDEEDGDIEFDLRLQDGMLVMANLLPDGTIDASVYDDSQGFPVRRVKRLPNTTADELASLLRPVVHASAR